MADGPSIALDANARNNATKQSLRLERWAQTRDAMWRLMDSHLRDGARVALIGAGSCDDVPLERITRRADSVDVIDFDLASTERGVGRLGDDLRSRVRVIEADVTEGCADQVLAAVRDAADLPSSLPLPHGPLGSGDYDFVVGDMLYTQLLHAGLIMLGVFGDRQRDIMRRFDPPFTNALVQRIQASLAPGGLAVHVHDVACWSSQHEQPTPLDEVLEDPFWHWSKLRRHDACDPHLALGRLGIDVVDSAWWRWPFEPNKEFLVRGTVARAGVAAGVGEGTIFRGRR